MDFQDRISQYPNRYKLVLVEGTTDTYDLVAIEGVVENNGTPLNATNLNTLAPKDSPEFTGTPKKNNVELASIDDTVAAAKKLVTSEPKLVSDVFTQRITATNDVEIIDSQPDVKTAEIKSIKGVSVKAVQKNGNFVGMTGWVLNNATATTSNGIATFTVTANSDCVITADSSQQKSIAGHKYYISAWIKAKYARSVDFGFSNDPIQFTAVANQWVRLSVIVTPSISDDVLYLTHDCSAQYVIGDKFDIQDFRCDDLTESSESIRNKTKAELDQILPNLPYFEGIRHTNIKKLTSTGDNLVNVPDHDEIVNFYYTDHSYGLLLLPNTQYKITFDYEIISTNATQLFANYGYGKTSFIGEFSGVVNYDMVTKKGTATKTFTTPATFIVANPILFIREARASSIHTSTVKISNIMVQFAVNPNTAYIPYKTDYVDIPSYELMRYDELIENHTHKKGTGVVTFDGNVTSLSIVAAKTFANTLLFVRAGLTFPKNLETSINTATSNYLQQKGVYNLDEEGFFLSDVGSNIYFRLNKSKLSGYSDTLTDAEVVALCKTYLATNPLTIEYPLAEPVLTVIPIWDNKYSAHNYGMELTDDLAEIDIVYPLDVVKQVETNTEILAENEKVLAKHDTDIATNSTDIATDKAQIALNKANIGEHNAMLLGRSSTPKPYAIAQYDENGKLKTSNPTAFNDCVRLADLNAMKLYHHNYEIGGAAGGGSTEFSYLIHISFYDRADGAMNNAQLNNYLNERGFLKSTGKSLSVTGIVIDESRNLASPAVAISYISASTFNIRYVSQYSNTLADVTATVSDIIVSNVYLLV